MESVDRFKAAMDSDRGALGPFMICTDPAMVEAAGHAGYDFVLLDMEHGTTTFQELPNLIRAANVTGVCPVVRVPRGSDIWIDQALDVGAGAVMIPQIDTAEQARAAVSAAKFSPVGTRGTCRFVRSAGFGAVPGSEYFSRAQDTVVILQAEGQKAIDNLDEILDVPGIDVVFVGPYDLSSSLGHVGEIDHPEVIAAIKQIIAKAAAKGVKIGCFADTVEGGKKWRDMGVKFIGYGCDTYIFMQAAKADVAEFDVYIEEITGFIPFYSSDKARMQVRLHSMSVTQKPGTAFRRRGSAPLMQTQKKGSLWITKRTMLLWTATRRRRTAPMRSPR